jgi:hypothetical protein
VGLASSNFRFNLRSMKLSCYFSKFNICLDRLQAKLANYWIHRTIIGTKKSLLYHPDLCPIAQNGNNGRQELAKIT